MLELKCWRKWRSGMKFEKVEVSGLVVLFIGVILLAATFYSAFMFLVGDITILTSVDLAELFGNALAPLIEAIIHILYLGIMGWIGSVMTIRAVQLLKKEKEATSAQPQLKPNPAPTTTQAQPKLEPQKDTKETKKENPEKAVIPQPPADPQRVAEKASEKTVEPAAT